MIDKATVKRILDTADIVEVVGDYVNLTRRGANYMGLCPFHNERTPSFSVSPSRGICHCFSCGKGGSPVNFIMEKEGINFHDALLHLAAKYGIKVEERELTDEERAAQSLRESMFVANEWAMKRFQENMLATDEGRNIGLAYFYQRGITQQAIDKFKLGYALDKPTDIYDAAIRMGFDSDILAKVGLCGIGGKSGRPYDRFKGRVIFPVLNSAGKVIAFGGRGIKGETAKYINSPESEIYIKSNELYGIYQAKNAIVREKKCFLVEGYMDVIGMWQCGMENVVASSGTSLTDGQIALIHRFTENVTLIYDGDAAGIKASLRGIDLLLSHNLDIKILLLPDGEDPDSFARKHTAEEFREYVVQHEIDFITFKTQTLLAGSNNSPSQRAEAVNSIVESLACISKLITRTLYIQECARVMGLSEQLLTVEVGKARERVMTRLRQQREHDRLQVQNPEITPISNSDQATTPRPNYAVSDRPSASSIKQDSLMAKVESNVIEYVVKYGMTDFCQNSEEGDSQEWLTVAEFVREEIGYDDMHFSNPLHEKVFHRILSLKEPFKEDLAYEREKISSKLRDERKAWVDEMIGKSMSMQELENAEKEYGEQQQEKERAMVQEYAASYIGRILGSDADDDIRRMVLHVITPKYTLSKYHSKNVHVETEAERLAELVPRAIIEWKDALLANRYKMTQAQLQNAAATDDMKTMADLMQQLQEISALRCEVAKSIGERIVTPRR